ncbi:MAG: acetylornithine deacetylase [Proteobacteria bacterium]|nr:acetylornithine deacetylase [Pseudomonadota bacterium]
MLDLLQSIRALVAKPSISSPDPALDLGNRAVIDCLAEWLSDAGWQVAVQVLGTHPAKANLIATLGRGQGGLLLAGHTDTVTVDGARWQHDPFAGEVVGDRIYGLGTADMKAFFALALEAARGLDPARLKQPLLLLATADEETSMAGARALLGTDYLRCARYAVIGEPTGLKPVRLHKGVLIERITIEGQAGHSSDPSFGASALEGIHGVMGELLAWRGELQRQHRDQRFSVPVPTLNLGCLHGGSSPNRICASCELQVDLRTTPAMDLAALRQTMQERIARATAAVDPRLRVRCEPISTGVPAFEASLGSALIEAVERLTGSSAAAASFATEAPFLQQLGLEPCVIGPGRTEVAHQPDEHLELASFEPTIALLRGLIDRFCLQPEEQRARPWTE